MSDLTNDMLDNLRKPFHPSQVTWKPGAVKGNRALALAYADVRAYMNRLDEVCGCDWAVAYEPWGNDRIICRLTIGGVTRSSTGESTNEAERSEIGGTVAEAQAFKRASAMFGLGRYLYNLPTGWADFDPASKKFTEPARAKLTAILMQQYRRATDSKAEMADTFAAAADDGQAVDEQRETLFEQFEVLGQDLYGDQWPQVCRRNVNRITGGKTQTTSELTNEQLQKLIAGMIKVRNKREPLPAVDEAA